MSLTKAYVQRYMPTIIFFSLFLYLLGIPVRLYLSLIGIVALGNLISKDFLGQKNWIVVGAMIGGLLAKSTIIPDAQVGLTVAVVLVTLSQGGIVEKLRKHRNVAWLCCALSLVFLLLLPVQKYIMQIKMIHIVSSLLVATGFGYGAFIIFAGIFLWLHKYWQERFWSVIFFAIPPFIWWTVALLAFYPGAMVGDSFASWEQAHAWNFDEWHPVGYTMLIKLLTFFWDYPTAVIWLQIITSALVIGYGLSLFHEKFSSRFLLGISCLIAVAPPNMLFIAFIKDVPFVICILALTILLIRILQTNGTWLENNRHYLLLLILVVLSLVRHNGIIISIGVIAYLGFLYWNRYKNMILHIGMLYVAMIILFNMFVYTCFPVNKHPGLAYSFPFHQIAAVVANNGIMSDQQRKQIEDIIPIVYIKKYYNPHTHDTFLFGNAPEISRIVGHDNAYEEILAKHSKEIIPLWFNLSYHNVGIFARDILDMTDIIWNVKRPDDLNAPHFSAQSRAILILGWNHPWHEAVIEKYQLRGYNSWKCTEKIKNHLEQYITYSYKAKLDLLFWGHGLYSILLFFLSGVILYSGIGKRYLGVLIPIIFNIGSLFISMPAPQYRYVWPTFVALPFILLYIGEKLKDRR